METSARGLDAIARFEGFWAKPDNDAAGHCTVGYGHLLHRGRCTRSELHRAGITRDAGLTLLASDVAKTEGHITRLVSVPLSQNQFDALVSLVFNIGGGAFAGSKLLRVLNAGRYTEVPRQIRRWVYAGHKKLNGLVRRRDFEAKLWSQDPPPAPQPAPPRPEVPGVRPAEEGPDTEGVIEAKAGGGVPWLALGGVLLVAGAGWFLWTSRRGHGEPKRKGRK
jgi:lysozyme